MTSRRTNHLTQFEQLLASHARIHTVQCVHLTTPSATNDALPSTTLVIESPGASPSQAMQIRCPRGGVSFHVAKGWRQEAGSVHVKAASEKHEVSGTYSASAKQMDCAAGAMTLVADQLRLQSSRTPLEMHSFSTRPNGIALRCPKGGVDVTAGPGGIVQQSAGDVDIQLRGHASTLRLATQGDRAHTIRLGNSATETVVENQLTVKGRLVLADTATVERRVSVVHELQNVLELGGARSRSADSSDGVAKTNTASHPDASGYDFAMLAHQGGRKSGMVYDHTNELFYFASELGAYQHHRFAHPRVLADVQARAVLAKQRVFAPFVDAHVVQCRCVRVPAPATGPSAASATLMLQAPTVKCSEKLACASVHAELGRCTRFDTTSLTTADCAVQNTLQVDGDVHAGGDVTLQKGRIPLTQLLANTVGPCSAHRTLQDALDDECGGAAAPPDHITMEPMSSPAHNCTALVNQPTLVLDGRHSMLTGTLELTDECEAFRLVDARADNLILMSSAEYQKEHVATSTITLRNVSGTVKDWHFDLPKCTLRLEYCTLRFVNGVTGTLGAVEEVFSVCEGNPWRSLNRAE